MLLRAVRRHIKIFSNTVEWDASVNLLDTEYDVTSYVSIFHKKDKLVLSKSGTLNTAITVTAL